MDSESAVKSIKRRAAELEAVIKSSQAELDELRVALRVFERLLPEAKDKGEDDGSGTSIAARSSGVTVGSMAVAMIEQHGPIDTSALLDLLRRNWREDLQQTTLSSTLSRQKSAGLIDRVDGKWRSVRSSEAGGSDPPQLSPGAPAPGDPEDIFG